MSDTPSANSGDRGSSFQAAKEAVASAEQVRANAPGAYDASAKAARYVREATADHPLPVVTRDSRLGLSCRLRQPYSSGRSMDLEKSGK